MAAGAEGPLVGVDALPVLKAVALRAAAVHKAGVVEVASSGDPKDAIAGKSPMRAMQISIPSARLRCTSPKARGYAESLRSEIRDSVS